MVRKNKNDVLTREQAKKILLAQKKELMSQLETIAQQDPYRLSGYSDENTQDDDAFEREGHHRVESIQKELSELLKRVDQALGRIEKGTYGVCQECQAKIDKARLEAVPYASLCMKCERAKGS